MLNKTETAYIILSGNITKHYRISINKYPVFSHDTKVTLDLFLGYRKRVLVHQFPNSFLQNLHHFSEDEDVGVVQILKDEFFPQRRRLVQVQEKLLHGWVTVGETNASRQFAK